MQEIYINKDEKEKKIEVSNIDIAYDTIIVKESIEVIGIIGRVINDCRIVYTTGALGYTYSTIKVLMEKLPHYTFYKL